MNYPNSDYYDINEKNKISFLRKNYLQSLQNFNRQFKVHSRNCLTNIQKKSKQYEFSDYEQMAEPKKPSPVLYQYSGYGKKVHHILDSFYNNITDKIKCFKQGDNNEDIFDVREYQRLLKKREEELYNNYKKNLSDNAKEGVSFYSIKRRYTPIIQRDNSSSILLAKIAKRNELCINPFSNKSDNLGESFLEINPILHPVDSYAYDYIRAKHKKRKLNPLSRSANL